MFDVLPAFGRRITNHNYWIQKYIDNWYITCYGRINYICLETKSYRTQMHAGKISFDLSRHFHTHTNKVLNNLHAFVGDILIGFTN